MQMQGGVGLLLIITFYRRVSFQEKVANDRYAIGKRRVAAVERDCLNAASDIIFILFRCLCGPSP